MKQPLYQSHVDGVGMSDSRRKWLRLHVPGNLSGMRVLDVGSNEGLLSHWCALQGAREVIGIDFDEERVRYAQQHYGSDAVRFIYQTWDHLPDGKFDLVLWASAMHYERDPRAVLEAIRDALNPGGMLILEAGVLQQPGREMVPVSRHSDVQMYPTRQLIEEVFLENFWFREVAPPERTPGDPVPRSVYHCGPKGVSVLFVLGATRSGKSNLANELFSSATKRMRLDEHLARVALGEFHHGALQEVIKANYDPSDLGKIYSVVGAPEHRHEFVRWLGEFVAATDRMVVFEGHLDKGVVQAFAARHPDYRVWTIERA